MPGRSPELESPDLKPKLKALCDELKMSGFLRVEHWAGKIVLRKRHYPVFTAMWCFGIVGVGEYLILTRIPDRHLGVFLMVAFFALFAVGFVALAVYMDRKKPLVVYDRSSASLSVPRLSFNTAELASIKFGIQQIDWGIAEMHTYGEVVYLIENEGNPESWRPFYVEHGVGPLRKGLNKFCQAIGVKVIALPETSVVS